MSRKLSDIFSGIGAKRLSAVEIDPDLSHQHEFNGVSQFKSLLGENKKSFEASFIYLDDREVNAFTDSGKVTWYDARENHETRSEHRLYFSGNKATSEARKNDLLVVGKIVDQDKLLILVAKHNTTAEKQVLCLFELGDKDLDRFFVQTFDDRNLKELNFSSKIILENIDPKLLIESEDPMVETLIQSYPDSLPSTKEMSSISYEALKNSIDPINDPDEALIALYEKETYIFKALEKTRVEKMLKTGINDVETFISYSLSVQNTRKSRAGKAFENHLSNIFDQNGLRYDNNEVTENNCKPDFIFPGISEYHNKNFKEENLTMLGVKTSLKDRWRQILSEADKIKSKHLATLQPSISKNQTDEIKNSNVTLVIPLSIHETFAPSQLKEIMSIKEFISLVKDKQKNISL